MKKIMKKALSLMLALVMVFTLAPMTAKAAATGEITLGSSVMASYSTAGENLGYTYHAEETGVITFEFYTQNFYCNVYEGTDTYGQNCGGGYFGLGSTFTANVEAGKDYYVDLWGSADGIIMFVVTFEAPSSSSENDGSSQNTPLEIVSGAMVELDGYAEKYIKLPAENNKEYTLTVQGGRMDSFDVGVYDANRGRFNYAASGSYGQPATTAVVGADDGVLILVQNTQGTMSTVQVTLTEVGGETDPNAVGTESNPADLLVNDEINGGAPVQLIANERNLYFYYCTWTAPATGKLSIAMIGRNCTDYSWNYAVMGGEWETLMLNSVDNAEQNPGEYYVIEGEELTIWFALPEYTAGQVSYVASFEECEYPEIEGPKFTYVADENYSMALKPLEIGANEVDVDAYANYDVTLYEFTAEEHAVYSFTVEEGCIGFWGIGATLATTGVLTNPNSEVQTIEVTLQANESAIVGLTGVVEEVAEITVAKVRDVEDRPAVEYEDAWFYGPSPEAYTFTGDVDELEYIDIEDDVDDFDKNVYSASDGYYHFGSEDGPIILVDLDGAYDWINPLVSADNGALKGEAVDGNAFNYSELYKFYASIADEETKLYPLNDDLIGIFMDAGKAQGWYNANFSELVSEDAWMFNCVYIPAKEVAPEGGSGSGESEKQPEKEPVKVEVPADKVIAESALGTAIQEAVANNAPLVVETTTEGVTLTFAPADLKDAEAVKLNVEVKLDVDVKDETVAKNDDITADNFVLKVEFSHDGKLPAKATITIPVPAKFANKTLFYYEILADGTLKFVCDAPVDADGNAKVTQDHCSDYVLLTEKVAEAPKTGDNTNFALWIAVLGLGVVAIAGSVVMKKREF